MKPIFLYDTTLRDGTQGENISFSAREKLKVALMLDDLCIHYIEGGWPGSNPRDMHFFNLAKDTEFKNAKIAAFGATRKPHINVEDDANIKALLSSAAPCVAIFGKTWDFHVKDIMKNSEKENLSMISESVSFLKANDKTVIYDAEHFFDGFRSNKEYALETLFCAAKSCADFLVLCDTNGGWLPFDIEKAVLDTTVFFNKKYSSGELTKIPEIGIHTHNDSGMAGANTISAVRAGATMVHGTINGYGERCGNTDLISIIPVLQLKMGYDCMSTKNLKKLKKCSRFVSEIANMIPANNRPFVGKSAFAHKGGIHVSAVMKNPSAYEHIDPEKVGNSRRVLISDLSGKSNVEYKGRELGIDFDSKKVKSSDIVSKIKSLEEDGFQFDLADGSFKILMEKLTKQFKPLFELKSFMVTVIKEKDRACTSQATIKISVEGKEKITVAEGHGPVSALDNALRKALNKFYPDFLEKTSLVDFKVRVIDGREGTNAKVRLIIESRDEDEIWNTIGVSEDLIEASWQALSDSLQYKLSKEKK